MHILSEQSFVDNAEIQVNISHFNEDIKQSSAVKIPENHKVFSQLSSAPF